LGRGRGMDWQEKITVQNCGRALVKPAWKGCAGSVMAEMKHNLQCGCLGWQKKQQHWIWLAQTLASA